MRTAVTIVLAFGLVLGMTAVTAEPVAAHSGEDWEPGETHDNCHGDCGVFEPICRALTLVPDHPTCV